MSYDVHLESDGLGPLLRIEVERQLLADLQHYLPNRAELSIDWSSMCPEGHLTTIFDGELQSGSDVQVRDQSGTVVGAGWVDFIHGGEANPLYVFWHHLDVKDSNGQWHCVKADGWIPDHVWAKLPEQTKSLCTRRGQYDARWSKDPKVEAWRKQKGEYGPVQ